MGKSSLMDRFVKDHFYLHRNVVTVGLVFFFFFFFFLNLNGKKKKKGVDFALKNMKVGGIQTKFQILDTGRGLQRFYFFPFLSFLSFPFLFFSFLFFFFPFSSFFF